MKRKLSLLVAAMLLGAAAPGGGSSTGAEIVQHSATLGFVPCMACHGAGLQGNVSIGAPALAGLPESVTLPALAAIADGKLGNNVVMQNIARTLSDQERKAVALYLAGLKRAKHPLNVVIAGGALLTSSQIVELSTGAEIVQSGTGSGALPCTTCHGAHLQGNASIGAPALAGMAESATLAALSAIAAGKMGSNEAMRNTARSLSPKEREAVAAYLAVTMPLSPHPPPGNAGTGHPGGSS
jgi:cytochrome c553